MLRAPAKQTATDTISTLCSRLNNATLLEDRRAAILGLRSFAKEFPASVASGALRALISSLSQDAEDVDTVKIVLETLLALFEPSEKSVEDSEDIALWLADEFSQRQDNITILLDFVEKPDYYSRFYALKILQAIFTSRDERTQECIISSPLGTTRLVSTLDDPREAVRDVGLRLLVGLTGSFPELQKLVAFENAFDRIFRIIEAEGTLKEGGIVVQDCLMLLHNLIRGNTANQSLFRESGGALELERLLPGGPTRKPQQENALPSEDGWTSPESEKNIWGLLSIIRLFLAKGSISTQPNQNAFARETVTNEGKKHAETNHALLEQVLNLAFDSTAIPVRAEALNVCADIIRGNPRLQVTFGGFHRFRTPAGQGSFKVKHRARPNIANGDKADSVYEEYVMEALLDLALNETSNALFDIRYAACECIQAYLDNNRDVKMFFLKRAIDGHTSGEVEPSNVLTALLQGPSAASAKDPCRIWFSAVVIFHLVFDDADAKDTLMKVAEGDAESGEEVVTCIQLLSGNLVAALHNNADEKISVAYLALLAGWLFEAPAAVNDFLYEGSTVPVLVQTATRAAPENTIRRGLCAFLLGILYEFSTRDSPIPRRELQSVLNTKLGRDHYLAAITNLRQHPIVRDFEVLSQAELKDADGVPQVYFDATFMDFLKENFRLVTRAIDRDPTLEVQITAGAVDRNVVDELRNELEQEKETRQKVEGDLLTAQNQINQEAADHRRTQESLQAEIARIKTVNEGLHKTHHLEQQKADANNRTVIVNLEKQLAQGAQQLQMQTQQAQKDSANAVEKARRPLQDQITQLKQTIDVTTQKATKAAADKDKLVKEHTAQLEAVKKDAGAKEESLRTQIKGFETSTQRTQKEMTELQNALSRSGKSLSKAEDQLSALQDRYTQLEAEKEKMKAENEALRTKSQDQIWKVKDAEEKARKAEAAVKDLEAKVKKAEKDAKDKEQDVKSVQGEMDDLVLVLADVEEKRQKDKKRLKELGEEISDDDDDDDDEDEEEDDDEDEEDEDGEADRSGVD